MNVLRWLGVQESGTDRKITLETLLQFYNELARKFLLEGKVQLAQFLLDGYLKQNLATRDI